MTPSHSGHGAIIEAAIGLHRVAVIACLICLLQTITASRWSAQRGAAIIFIFVAIIAALITRLGLEEVSTNAATDGCRALVGAAVAIADVTIITIFACLNKGIPATSDGAEVCATRCCRHFRHRTPLALR